MTCFVLIPGSGGTAWYWSRVAPLLVAAGHEARPVDLPGDDETAGIREYADLVVRTAQDGDDVVLVAQSMGGFTAALVCEQISVAGLTFVNAMIPDPGETAGEWWASVDAVAERERAADAGGYSRDFDLATYFLHDVRPEVAAEGEQPASDPDFAAFRRLTLAGKPKKVIRIALAHKLLVRLNAKARDVRRAIANPA